MLNEMHHSDVKDYLGNRPMNLKYIVSFNRKFNREKAKNFLRSLSSQWKKERPMEFLICFLPQL